MHAVLTAACKYISKFIGGSWSCLEQHPAAAADGHPVHASHVWTRQRQWKLEQPELHV